MAALLAGPSLAEPAPEPPPEAVVGVLPFEANDEPNRILVDLAPEGGRPFVMMLDTGASDSVITPRMARELGVRVRALKSTPYRRATRLGRDLQFWIDTQSSDTAARTGWEYGLLGAEFLNDFVLELDFPGRRVRFLDPKRYEVPEAVAAEDERVAAVKLTSSRPIVSIRVNGRELPVILDTGAPLPGILSGAALRELGVDPAGLPVYTGLGTAVGQTESRLLEASAFEVMGLPLGPVALVVAPKGLFNMGAGNDSVVGYDVLAPLVVRIDYPRKRLWLRRVRAGAIRFGGADYALAREAGVQLVPGSGGWVVRAVAANSTAEKAGLRVGDWFASSASDPAPVDEALRTIRDGQPLTVKRQQGEGWIDVALP
jgi:predicted aspartyl protease